MTFARQILNQLQEGLSKILYHYTTIHKLASILDSNSFRLANSAHGSADDFVRPKSKRAKDKFYYLSMARSPSGRYNRNSHHGSVEIVLDGEKLGNKYEGKAIDYWGDNFRKASKGDYEMEDRLYSKEPTIPDAMSYMKEIHVMYKIDADDDDERDDNQRDVLRECWLKAKLNKIAFFVYDDGKAFQVLDKRKALPLDKVDLKLKNQQYKIDKSVPEYPVGAGNKEWRSNRWDRSKDQYDIWLELYYKTKIEDLSKKAKDKMYNLHYSDAGSNLENQMHGTFASLETSKIVKIIQKEGFSGAKDLVNFIREKWNKIRKEADDKERQERLVSTKTWIEDQIKSGADLDNLIKVIQHKHGYDTEVHGNTLSVDTSWSNGPVLKFDIPGMKVGSK